jgi:hypothetical protein
MRLPGKSQIEAGVVNGDNKVDSLRFQRGIYLSAETQEIWQSRDYFDEAHDGEIIYMGEELYAFPGHQRTSQADQTGAWNPRPQCPRQSSPVKIAGGLSNGEEYDVPVACCVVAQPVTPLSHQNSPATTSNRSSRRPSEGGFFAPLPPSSRRSRRARINDI